MTDTDARLIERLRSRGASEGRRQVGRTNNARAMIEAADRIESLTVALEAIRDMEPKPFTGRPDDWSDQIDACPDCQRYGGHPIQAGICNVHRQPLYEQESHDRHEREAMRWRMSSIARAALGDSK